MSYEIIYQKQFIKATKDGKEVFLPMIEAGSNNCYEASGKNARRARSWFVDTNILNGKLYGTLDEMLKRADEIRQGLIDSNKKTKEEYADWDTYEDDRFGWFAGIAIGSGHTSKSTFGQFKGIYKTGVAKALTVEELAEAGISTIIYVYTYDSEKFEKLTGFKPFRFSVKTNDELIKAIDEKNQILEPFKYKVSVTLDGWDGAFKRLRKKFAPIKKKKEWVYVDEFFVLENDNGYFVKNTARGYRYSYYKTGGKKFATEKEANTFKKNMKNGDIWQVRNIKERVQVLMVAPESQVV